ncbi:G-rich sequence factor 1 [Chanos chanos]|uniref:G-rich sequence factor 1 n=1 Tax=Chanos chanos TaxID=29144 RepID=A0A6J2VAK3_CHACN|nr:G-rich sequence factor 1-like [Chanos chanos]
MSGISRTALISSLVRCLVGRQCLTRIQDQKKPAHAVCRLIDGFDQARYHYTRSSIHAYNLTLKSSLTSCQRSLTSEADTPFEEDEYPPLPEYNPNPQPERKEFFIIRAKGLPWSCTPQDLMDFFSECRIRDGLNGIHLTQHRDGRPNGQAIIELESEEDVSKALEKHRQYMGHRYVEVYEVTDRDAEVLLSASVAEQSVRDGVVRLRGLPFSCTERDVIQFFSGLEIVKDGVTLVMDHRMRRSGDAFVQFASQEMAEEALKRDREIIGNRYIEIFPSRRSEIRAQYGRLHREALPTALHHNPAPTPTMSDSSELVHHRSVGSAPESGPSVSSAPESGPSVGSAPESGPSVGSAPESGPSVGSAPESGPSVGSAPESGPSVSSAPGSGPSVSSAPGSGLSCSVSPQHYVHMRGLPYECTAADIIQFFSPVRLAKVVMEFGPDGQASGEAEAYFRCHEDAVSAMSKDKTHIYNRYIELFLNSSPGEGQ